VKENIEALHAAGVFRMCTSKRFGGLETDLPTQFEVIRTLGRGCGSTSWVAQVYAACAWLASMFPDEVQQEVFSDPDVLVAGIFSPSVVMTPTRGGFLLNGKWPFNSGCLDAKWNVVAAFGPSEEHAESRQWARTNSRDPGALLPYLTIIPMTELEILDDWNVSGLRGTASNSTVATEVFVPQERVIPMAPVLEGRPPEVYRDHTLYKYAAVPLFMSLMYAPSIGMAQGAMGAFLERLPGRRFSFESQLSQRESPVTHLRVAEAAMKIELALLLARQGTRFVHECALADRAMSIEERVQARAHVAYAIRLSREASELLSSISGGSSIHMEVAIQRFLRDLVVASKHVLVDFDPNMMLYGGTLVGLETEASFL
jgi:alkylation response protein AidB-like acyl-CoA dehydrogenase